MDIETKSSKKRNRSKNKEKAATNIYGSKRVASHIKKNATTNLEKKFDDTKKNEEIDDPSKKQV